MNPYQERLRSYAKNLERMERDPDGRAMLAERYGSRFSQPATSGPFVQILVPSYSESTPKKFENALHALIAYSRSKGINVYQPLIFGHSLISWVRNEMLAKVVKDEKPSTHALFIDDDIVPEPDALVKMLAHGKDIVGALCTRRSDPPIPNLRSFDEQSGDVSQMFQWKNHGELIEVDAVGTGMMLLSAAAIETVADYTLSCGYEKKLYGDAPNFQVIEKQRRSHFEKTGDALWFQLLPALSGSGEYGEDISFCLKARFAGLKIHVDTTITPKHLGIYGFGFDDFVSHRAEEIAKAGQILQTPDNADLAELIESK